MRYDANALSISENDTAWLRAHFELVPLCPEVAAGLPTPRAPAEIQFGTGKDVLNGRADVVEIQGTIVTPAYIKGARLALAKCQQQNIRLALLAEHSPSCGSQSIYKGTFTGEKIAGQGVTAALLGANDIQVFSHQHIDELQSWYAIHSTQTQDE